MVRGQGHCPNALRLLSSMSTITTGRTAELRGLVVWKKSKLLSLSSSSGRGSQTRMASRTTRRDRPILRRELNAWADLRNMFFIGGVSGRRCDALLFLHLAPPGLTRPKNEHRMKGNFVDRFK